MLTSLDFYLVAIPAILIASISKGGFGGGLVVMAVPILSLVMSPVQAAALMMPSLLAMDAVCIRAFWQQWDRDILRLILPAATLGIGIGWLMYHLLNGDLIRILVGLIAVAFTMKHWGWLGKADESHRPSDLSGRFWGTIAGFTSFVAHAGGPPVSMYLLPLRLPQRLYVATTVPMFAAINVIKLVPYYQLNQFSAENLGPALVLLPIAILGTQAGVWLHDRISPLWFYRICYLLLFVTGIKLLVDGGMGWINQLYSVSG